jgi:CO/xanthine dehydrogenase FAD-binding subunit
MAILAEHHTPKSFAEALDLLAERTSRRVPLAGGTHLIGALESRQRQDVDGVVNLAGLDLAFFLQEESVLRIGAMTTITDLIELPACADLAGSILPRTARFEGPLNLRNAATVGGLAALAEPDSELYAALLALNASVVAVDRQGFETRWQLDESPFAQPQSTLAPMLITEIQLPLSQAAGGHARIARTPMDRCIVAAVAIAFADSDSSPTKPSTGGGSGMTLRTALCGVGPHPQLAGAALDPHGDFKGSASYRRAMAEVVSRRARAAVNGSSL